MLVAAAAATAISVTGSDESALLPPLPGVPSASPSPSTGGRFSTVGAVPQQAKPRPTPVLLGPPSPAALQTELSRYCRATAGAGSRAKLDADDDWTCSGGKPIDMDAACTDLYDDDAWADLRHDGDPQTWRCYRDGP